MPEWQWRDPELEQMLENSRDAVRRSQELIEQTESLLKQSRMILGDECVARPRWPLSTTDHLEP
jgi:hypothetical protein